MAETQLNETLVCGVAVEGADSNAEKSVWVVFTGLIKL